MSILKQFPHIAACNCHVCNPPREDEIEVQRVSRETYDRDLKAMTADRDRWRDRAESAESRLEEREI